MKSARRRPEASFLLVFLAALPFVSCTGTGGSADSSGALYGGSGSGLTGVGLISALGSADADVMLSIFGWGDGVTEVAFDAEEIELPSGGSVAMTISGIDPPYSGVAQADADGKVRFLIPVIASGTTVTVSLEVRDADGNTVSSGSETKTVRGERSEIHVTLSGGGTAGSDPTPPTTGPEPPSTPGGTVTCTGTPVPDAPYTWYVNNNTNLGTTELRFTVTATNPDWDQYNWFVNDSQIWGWAEADYLFGINLGSVIGSFDSSVSIEAYCSAKRADGTEVRGDTITLTFKKQPSMSSANVTIIYRETEIGGGLSLSIPGYETEALGLTYNAEGLPAGTTVRWTVTGNGNTATAETAVGESTSLSLGFLGDLDTSDTAWPISVSCTLELEGTVISANTAYKTITATYSAGP